MRNLNHFRSLIIFVSLILFISCQQANNPEEGNSFTGTVKNLSDKPVSSALVVASNQSDVILSLDTTDANGSYTLINLPSDFSKVKVTVSHPNYRQYADNLASIREKTKSSGSIIMQPMTIADTCCGRLELRIRNSSGEALANAEVRVNESEEVLVNSRADSLGNFVLNNICPGTYWYRIAKDGYQVVEANFTLDSCDTISRTVEMQRTNDSCCHGKIILNIKDSTSNNNLNGATVRLWKGSTKVKETTSNADGRAVFENICPGEYQISILKENFTGVEFSFDMECNDSLFFARKLLEKCCNGVVIVNVKDSTNNESLNGAVVRLWQGGTKVREVYTENGRVIFRELCEGSFAVSINKDGYRGKEFDGVHVGCNDTLEYTKYLGRIPQDTCCKGVIIVDVKDSTNNESINGAIVRLWKNGTKIREINSENGRVMFRELCEGTYAVSINKEGFREKEFGNIQMGCNDTLEFTKYLGRIPQDTCCKGVIIVNVKDSTNNESVNGAVVRLWKNGTKIREINSENGRVMFRELCEGTYSVSINKEGYREKGFDGINMGCNDTLEYTKYLGRIPQDTCCKGVIIVSVRDSSNNESVNGAVVRLWKNGTKIREINSENGRVMFRELCEGTYAVSINKDGFREKEFGNIQMECNDTLEYTQYLGRIPQDTCCTAVLRVRIRDRADSTYMENVMVQIRLGSQNIATVYTNNEGGAGRENLCAPATYNIRISKDGYVVREINFSYTECNTKTETIWMERQ